jgi:HSP20 family protein
MSLGTLTRQRRPSKRVVRHDFDHLLDDLWSGFGLAPLAFGPPREFAPAFDAVEFEHEYRVTAEIPGVEAADLEVVVEDGVLNVKGRRHDPDEAAAPDAVTNGAERGHFERRIRFPGEIVEGDVKARYKNGVLRVTLPKPAELKPEVRSVLVETA